MEECKECGSCFCFSIDESYTSLLPHHLATTNDPPLDSERPALKSLLDEATKDLTDVNEEIWEVQNKLDSLYCRQKSIKRTVAEYKGALSVVRSVPREIWTEIFNMAIPSKAVTFRADKDIWQLGRVCRIWKDAAIACSCWATVVVPDFSPQPGSRLLRRFRAASREILQTILGYNAARSRPVNFTLILHTEGSFAQGLLDVAIQHCELWQNVTLHLTPYLQEQLQHVFNRLHRLRSLELKTMRPDFDMDDVSSWVRRRNKEIPDTWRIGAAFQNAPLLQKLVLQVTNAADPSTLNLPWSQINDFTLNTDYAASTVAFVPLCAKMPNLTSFSGWNAIGVAPGHTLKLSKVQNLSLSFDFPDVVDSVVLPGLKEITMLWPTHLHRVGNLIERSGCKVTRVSIQSLLHATPDGLLRFFERVPDLKALEFMILEEPRLDKLLQTFDQSPNVLSQLEELNLPIGCNGLDKLIRKLVTRDQSLLKRLRFLGPTETKRAEERYEELVQEFGARVEIGPRPPSVRQLISKYQSDTDSESDYSY